MSAAQPPSVEVVQAPRYAPAAAQSTKRLGSFLVAFFVLTAIGLAVVYGRSPVYQASASVLTVKPKAVDRDSALADLEHVAIQGRNLMSEALLQALSQQLKNDGLEDEADVPQLLKILEVAEIPATNLLELRATGHEPETLQLVVNRWAESYEHFRRKEIKAATQLTSAELIDEQTQLAAKIDEQRAALLEFRETHDIVSLERGENRSLAGLKGLNTSLNQARDRLIQAQARQSSIKQAKEKGSAVIPDSQKAAISSLKLELSRTENRLENLREKYTERYIERDPTLQKLPQQLAELQSELNTALALAAQTAAEEADQDLATARATVVRLEEQLGQQQQGVQTFTGHFKTFKNLEDALQRLERLRAENEQRLAEIEIRNQEKFPAIKVVEWARLPVLPLYPDYDRDLGIALASALILALFLTWLREYLTASPQDASQAPLVGVRVITEPAPVSLASNPAHTIEQMPIASANLSHEPTALANPGLLPRELAPVEIKALASGLDQLNLGKLSLLLSGISPGEMSELSSRSFDQTTSSVVIHDGPYPREVPLGQSTWLALEDVRDKLETGERLDPDTLDLRLIEVARTQGLADPTTINALALWHSYVVYLVRQGIDANGLSARVGFIDAAIQPALAAFAPAGGPRSSDAVMLVHPALSDANSSFVER